MRRLLAVLVVVSAILGGTVSPSAAITFGREVTNGSSAYPSVVSIWTAEDAAIKLFERKKQKNCQMKN